MRSTCRHKTLERKWIAVRELGYILERCMHRLTTATFHLLLTGALGVNMIVRSFCEMGVFNHSREDIRSQALTEDKHQNHARRMLH